MYQDIIMQVDSGKRLASMILDHMFMTFIGMLFVIPLFTIQMSALVNAGHNPVDLNVFSSPFIYIAITGFVLYFCKDSINGRSIGKRILKLQVVNNATDAPASPVQCLVRNLFCIIWPIEVLVTLGNPNRRIGDYVAGTKVVVYVPEISEPSKVKIGGIILSFAIAYFLLAAVVFKLSGTMWYAPKPAYIESSYSEQKSKELEQLYADSMSEYITTSFRVYDSIAGSSKMYISAIYYYNQDYDDDGKGELKKLTKKLLYSKYPESIFSGQAQYIYRSSNSYNFSSSNIGS